MALPCVFLMELCLCHRGRMGFASIARAFPDWAMRPRPGCNQLSVALLQPYYSEPTRLPCQPRNVGTQYDAKMTSFVSGPKWLRGGTRRLTKLSFPPFRRCAKANK